jgi:hypothetical protein
MSPSRLGRLARFMMKQSTFFISKAAERAYSTRRATCY